MDTGDIIYVQGSYLNIVEYKGSWNSSGSISRSSSYLNIVEYKEEFFS